MLMIESKINDCIKLIQKYEPAEGYMFAFSGGRDSSLVKKLLELSNVSFEAWYFVFTTENDSFWKYLQKMSDLHYVTKSKTVYDLCRERKELPMATNRFCRSICKIDFSVLYNKSNIVVTGYKSHDVMHNWVGSFWYKKPDTDNVIFSPIYDWSETEISDAIDYLNIGLYEEYYRGGRAYSCPLGSCLYAKTKQKNIIAYPDCFEKFKELAIYCYENNEVIREEYSSPEEYLKCYLGYDSKGEWTRIKQSVEDLKLPKAYICGDILRLE